VNEIIAKISKTKLLNEIKMINEQGKISEIIYIFESTKRSCRHEKHKD
jgi:hypothetical protein